MQLWKGPLFPFKMVNYSCNWIEMYELRPLKIQTQHCFKCYFSFVWMCSVTSSRKVLKWSSQTLSKLTLCWKSCSSCCLLSTSMAHSLKLKTNGKIENRKRKCSVQWVPNQGTPMPPTPPLALLFLEISILSSQAVIQQAEPPTFPPAPWSSCGWCLQGSSVGELWQVSNSVYLFPRHLLLERSLCFFGIYTFKSKLQKKASLLLLSVATL